MAERKAERKDAFCPSCRQSIEDERKHHQKKIKGLEDEITLLRGHRATAENFLKENKVLREKLQKIEIEFKQFKKENEHERLQAEADTAMLEQNYRQSAATKKDVEEICTNLLSSQYTSLKKEKAEIKEFMAKISDVVVEKIKDQLMQRCQEDAEKCRLLRSDLSKLQAQLNRAQYKENKLLATIEDWKQYTEKLQEYGRRKETEHALMTQKIVELEEELQKQQNAVKKSHSNSQPDVHEDLHMEYEKIVTKFEVLKQVEGNFEDSFYAKGFLSDIFMDAYEECKKCLKNIVWQNIDELFKVQTCENRTDDMEGLSYAFGLLLQYSGIKLQLTKSEAVAEVKKKVKENVKQLKRYNKAIVDPARFIEDLPLNKFVKLAWKFVTQAYPVIVTMPTMLAFNEDMHKSSYHHWDEEKKDGRPLIYAQPIVYRSYHGEVLIKGLVGNF